MAIGRDMASQRVELFLRAKQALRIHRDWTDDQVAEHVGIPRPMIEEIMRPARQEVEQDG